MDPAPRQPKGILKTSTDAPGAPPQSVALPTFSRERLNFLQEQLQKETCPPVPIEVFERLSAFPRMRGPGVGAGSPAPVDVHDFKLALEAFQPSEYQDLVEERNCLGNCGYTLCPEAKRNYVGEAKIRSGGVAKVAELNKWCSESCARRALFIQVQLENPTFMLRNGEKVIRIDLREEDSFKRYDQKMNESTCARRLVQDDLDQPDASVDRLQPSKEAEEIAKTEPLAAERDSMGWTKGPRRTFTLAIREKQATSAPKIPDSEPDGHLMMEGHRTIYGFLSDRATRPT